MAPGPGAPIRPGPASRVTACFVRCRCCLPSWRSRPWRRRCSPRPQHRQSAAAPQGAPRPRRRSWSASTTSPRRPFPGVGPIRVSGTVTNVDDQTWTSIALYAFMGVDGPMTTQRGAVGGRGPAPGRAGRRADRDRGHVLQGRRAGPRRVRALHDPSPAGRARAVPHRGRRLLVRRARPGLERRGRGPVRRRPGPHLPAAGLAAQPQRRHRPRHPDPPPRSCTRPTAASPTSGPGPARCRRAARCAPWSTSASRPAPSR